MQRGPLLVPCLRSELTPDAPDSPSCDFIHGLHGKVFSAKAIVLVASNDSDSPQQVECDGPARISAGIKGELSRSCRTAVSRGRTAAHWRKGRWLAFRSTVSGPMPLG